MKISEQVENILKKSEIARNSDRELELIFMAEVGMDLSEKQKDVFRDMPSMEIIRRVRQKFQENGQYTATERVRNVRKHKSYVVQQNAPTATPKTMARVINDVGDMPKVIGEDEPLTWPFEGGITSDRERNKLRAKQRKAIDTFIDNIGNEGLS